MLAAIPRPGLPAVARRAKAGAIPQRRRHNHRRRSELSIPMAIAYRGTVIAGRFHSLAARAVSGLWIAILSVALTSTAALARIASPADTIQTSPQPVFDRLAWNGLMELADHGEAPWRGEVGPKTRVWGFGDGGSGQPCFGGTVSHGIATGSDGFGYETASGRLIWPNRDPLGEMECSHLYAFVCNSPLQKIDPFGLYMVPKCTIEILVGHNRPNPPNVPSPIKNEPCSAASVVACSGGTISVDIEIPNIEPRPEGTINLAEAGRLARSDFAAGLTHAKTICKSKCGCPKVTITIKCIGIGFLESLAMPAGVCGKKTIIDCSKCE